MSMQPRTSLLRAASFPVTVGVGLLAVALTGAYWAGRDMTALMLEETAFFGQPWRLLTSALLHGDVVHLLFNVYWLWVFGTLLEATLGAFWLLGLMTVLALISGAAQFAVGSGGIGLSGIGYGLFGFLFVAQRRDARFADAVDAKTSQLFGVWFLLCLALTRARIWNIANMAHAAGAFAGFAAGIALLPARSTERTMPRAGGWIGLSLLLMLSLLGATSARPTLNLDEQAGLEVGGRAFDALTAGRDAEAIPLFERAVLLSPREPTLWFNLGIAYQREQRLADAGRAYRRAAELEPAEAKYVQAAALFPAAAPP
jgi:membrane associated rhomboid family serine protease